MSPDLPRTLAIFAQFYSSYHYHDTSAHMSCKTIEQMGGIIGTMRDKVKTSAETNVPDRFELFLLGPGEKKVTVEPDTRVPHCAMFHFNKEDHTLANMLRSQLLRTPNVIFAGYRVPHPLFSTFDIRIQTNGEISPKDALVEACKELINKLKILDLQFKHEFAIKEAMNAKGAAAGDAV
ncbi:MAG: DNA-directed RNA polymerase II core subunit [Geoglossum simile]|nr:MAG: DNA-directed RNA polymerase II core subunit [Geoglossum simile]